MLKIDIIEKRFGKDLLLQNISLHIKQPGLYGLVGKNGQGKTTLFRCILDLEKYEGSCRINDRQTSLQEIAWCAAEPEVYDQLTAREYGDFYAHLLGLDKTRKPNLFEVPQDKLIKEFSTGMKKKVYLNAVFQKEYEVYFLDEPFNGLDLESNHILMEQLVSKASSSIVIISSHIIDVLYRHCEQIFVIKDKGLLQFERDNYNGIQEVLFEQKSDIG